MFNIDKIPDNCGFFISCFVVFFGLNVNDLHFQGSIYGSTDKHFPNPRRVFVELFHFLKAIYDLPVLVCLVPKVLHDLF